MRLDWETSTRSAAKNNILGFRVIDEPENAHAAITGTCELVSLFGHALPKSMGALQSGFYQFSNDMDSEFYGTLRILYQALVLESEVGQRQTFLNHILEQIEFGKLDSVVLRVFVQFEPDHKIVSHAVKGYLRLKPADYEEPFAAANDLIEIIHDRNAANRGAVFAALVCFGDRRICALARTVQESLAPADARSFALAVSGPLNVATLEFCLGWLVQVVKENNDDLVVPISSAISVLVIKDSSLLVYNDKYNFGPYGFFSRSGQPPVKFSDLLIGFKPIIDFLRAQDNRSLNQMIEILEDPGSVAAEELERRARDVRRKDLERRASDRRILKIVPRLERREVQQRGSGSRRVEYRR